MLHELSEYDEDRIKAARRINLPPRKAAEVAEVETWKAERAYRELDIDPVLKRSGVSLEDKTNMLKMHFRSEDLYGKLLEDKYRPETVAKYISKALGMNFQQSQSSDSEKSKTKENSQKDEEWKIFLQSLEKPVSSETEIDDELVLEKTKHFLDEERFDPIDVIYWLGREYPQSSDSEVLYSLLQNLGYDEFSDIHELGSYIIEETVRRGKWLQYEILEEGIVKFNVDHTNYKSISDGMEEMFEDTYYMTVENSDN